MAELLSASDEAELREIVDRWAAEAPTERIRGQYRVFGAKLLELKAALGQAPTPPTREELVLALDMMLRLAAMGGEPPPFGGAP
jgi:hypothetical protein